MWPVAEHSFKNQIYPPCLNMLKYSDSLPTVCSHAKCVATLSLLQGGQKPRKAVDVGALIKAKACGHKASVWAGLSSLSSASSSPFPAGS